MPSYAAQIAAGKYAILWVCQCCMLCHANGECCAEDHEYEPLSDIPATADLSMGNVNGADEHRDFDAQQCDGCGSSLHGDRHAMILVFDMRAAS